MKSRRSIEASLKKGQAPILLISAASSNKTVRP